MHLDLDLQKKAIRVQGQTFGGHHGDVLKASKRKHKVYIRIWPNLSGCIVADGAWVRIPEHLPPVWSSASLFIQPWAVKAPVLLGLRILQKVKYMQLSAAAYRSPPDIAHTLQKHLPPLTGTVLGQDSFQASECSEWG